MQYKIKRVLSLLVTISLLISLFISAAPNVLAAPSHQAAVCEVNGNSFSTLDAAIAAAADGSTIKLLNNINYSGGLVPAYHMSINLNGYALNVTNMAGAGLTVNGSNKSISITGAGALNIIGTTYGVYAINGGKATVTTVTSMSDSSVAVFASGNGSTVTVNGNVTANGNSSVGVYTSGDSTCTVVVNGNVTAGGVGSFGAKALGGSIITVNQKITATNFLLVGTTAKNKADGVSQGRYVVYTDGMSTIQVMGNAFFKENCEGMLTDNWEMSNGGWSFTSNFVHPSTTAKSGAKAAMFNSRSLEKGRESRLSMKSSLNLARGTNYQLEFSVYQDDSLSGNADYVMPQISLDGGLSWLPLLAAPIFRYHTSSGWVTQRISLSAYIGYSDVKIGFYGHSDKGNNLYIDDISVSQICVIDGCSLSEADGGLVSSRVIDGKTYYEISTAEQLAHINTHLGLNYIQTTDIDLSESYSTGWTPIGTDEAHPFICIYNGNGHAITGLKVNINLSAQSKFAGLFGVLRGGAEIRNLSVFGSVSNKCSWYATNVIAGGIAAYIDGQSGTDPIINNCSFKGDVSAVGLVSSNNNSIQAFAGGIVGYASEASVRNCSYNGGTITAWTGINPGITGSTTSSYAGGIAGVMTNASVLNGYVSSLGAIRANNATNNSAGGIAGRMNGNGVVAISYNAAAVSATPLVGGAAYIGGICGYASDTGAVTASYWRDTCGANDQFGNKPTAASPGKMTAAVMKTTELRDALITALNTFADKTLYIWQQTPGSYPILTTELWTQPIILPPNSDNNNQITTISDGKNTITQLTVTPTTVSGVSSVTLTESQLEALLEKGKKAGGTDKKDTFEIVVKTTEGVSGLAVTMSQASLVKIAAESRADFAITSPFISISFDGKAVDTITGAAAGGQIVISASVISDPKVTQKGRDIVSGRPVFDFSVTNGGQQVTKFKGGHATITIPYTLRDGEKPHEVVIFYLADNGMLKAVRGHYDAKAKAVTFKTTHFSSFVIGYNNVSFADVSADSWYGTPVTFIAARGITTGVDSTHFAPDKVLTRAQFMVMLMRAFGLEPADAPSENFDDAGNTYYTNYLSSAKLLGIAEGVGNNRFVPEKAITREEMFTLLYRALIALEELPEADNGKTLNHFSDASKTSDYAKEALGRLIACGIITGNNGKLDPGALSTRAQMAQMLYNLLSK